MGIILQRDCLGWGVGSDLGLMEVMLTSSDLPHMWEFQDPKSGLRMPLPGSEKGRDCSKLSEWRRAKAISGRGRGLTRKLSASPLGGQEQCRK